MTSLSFPRTLNGLTQWVPPGGEPPNAIQDAIPYMLAAMTLEALVSMMRGKGYYRARLTFCNISAGVIQQSVGTLTRVLNVLPYFLVRGAVAGGGAATAVGTWRVVVSVIGVDLAYYAFHRAAHTWNVAWALHVTHHSSPDYNLSTALRQGSGEMLLSWAFFLPLALVVDIRSYTWWKSINVVYQFWVHTQMVPQGGLGPLEWVLNTPSHHRVHHARNYPRCNYGGMFIIFDRMFGTFVPEDAERKPCLYGLDANPAPLGTHNPVWHQIHVAVGIGKALLTSPPAEWPGILFTRRNVPYLVSEGGRVRRTGRALVLQPQWSWLVDTYVFLHLILLVPAAFVFISKPLDVPLPAKVAAVTGISLTVAGMGLLMDGSRWGQLLEMARLGMGTVSALHLLPGASRLFVCSVLASSALLVVVLFHEPVSAAATKSPGGAREAKAAGAGASGGVRRGGAGSTAAAAAAAAAGPDGGGVGGGGGTSSGSDVVHREGRRSLGSGRRPTPKMRQGQEFR